MISISFSSLHFTINGSEPSISQLKILFSKESDFPLRHSNIEYLFNSCRIDENLYWIYARHGKQYPYSSSVLNTETKSEELNPKTERQIELNKQLFAIYDAKNHDLYLSNYQKKAVIEHFFRSKSGDTITLKNFYKSPESFFSNVSSINSVQLISKSDLLNQDGNYYGIEPSPNNLFGFGVPARWSLTANYKNKKPTQAFINKIKSFSNSRHEANIEKLLCIGHNDDGMEQIFNLDSFISKIDLTESKPTNGLFDQEDVKQELISIIKKGISNAHKT